MKLRKYYIVNKEKSIRAPGFLEGVRQREMFSLPVVVLLFPTITVFLSAVGFLFNIPVSAWQGVLGFFVAAGFAGLNGVNWRERCNRIVCFAGLILGIFALDQSFIFFSWWDAQAYHLPAAKFLLDGWNPVFAATRETLLTTTGAAPASFNAYHVAYLPRAGWIWSAVTASITGNLESGDTLILLTASVLCGLSWRVTPLLFGAGRWKRFFFASLTLLSPGVVASVFCGAQDGSQYALLLIFLLAACAYRKTGSSTWLPYLMLAPVLGGNLKFTGMIALILSVTIFTCPLVWQMMKEQYEGRKFWKWIVVNAMGFLFAGLVGFSPYLTNWVNHGGPFYPEHSFIKQEPLPAMTADFDLMNDDAAAMGYTGRVVNAYFSKWLAHRYYEWKMEKKPFNPVFHLDQVSGLGTGFRIVMCLTLVILCLTRRCGTPWLLISILVTSFLQPTKTVGYVRYVPQLWMFPILVAFNAMTVNKTASPYIGRGLGIVVTALLATSTYVFALGKFIFSLGMSIYALSLVESMQAEENPRVYVLSLHDRYREDGRCLAAWETLPRDIPAPHVFDLYYRYMLSGCGVLHPDWQTSAQMQDLRALGTPCFYLGEHLWYWPQDPTEVKLPGMHFYAGHPRKPFTGWNVMRIAGEAIPKTPYYLWRITRFRWLQWKVHWRKGNTNATG